MREHVAPASKHYIYDEAECFRFHVEGSLSDAQAKDLEHSRRTASSVIGSRGWVLTLDNVTCIEAQGRALLRQWSQEGVRIFTTSSLLRTIVRSIVGQPVRFEIGSTPSASQVWERYVDSAVFRVEHDPLPLAPSKTPHPLIHKWAATRFLPGSTLAEALRVTRDVGRSGCQSCIVQVSDRHAYIVASTTRIHSVSGPSVLRRLVAITRFHERDGGVSHETQAIGLACDVPAGLGRLIEPLVRLLSRGALPTSLRRMCGATARSDLRGAVEVPPSPIG
ncbi:MAG TPA: hypothetical protein VMT15_08840 [Bryobacteraceae bacterium]|nr:hypothetical protein [Candidatus Acidoferrales bacterium]HVO98159.1 hypothetical protein [Bryobacteraceae bacterium]HXK07840.1 hypothetical protein [Verrucomicrobiae bacterium]